jgi:hypothetical protein
VVITAERFLWAVLLLAAFGAGFVVGRNYESKNNTLHIEIMNPLHP